MTAHLWLVYALSASIIWGMGYAVTGKLLKIPDITPAFLMMSTGLFTLPIYFFLTFYLGQMKQGFDAIFSSKELFILFITQALAIVGGNFLIFHSITEKNATLTSLIEISYPLFVIIFTFLFFKEVHLSWGTAFGGFLIFAGIGIIYLKS